MKSIQGVLRALDIGFAHRAMTSFVLDDRAYIAVGKVEDAERDYICLPIGEHNIPQYICLLTFNPKNASYDERRVTHEDSFRVGDGQSIDCMMLSALTLGAFYCFGYLYAGNAQQLIVDSSAIALAVIVTAEAAGIFGGRAAYESIMQFGEHSNRRSRDPQGKELRALRRACRPSNPDGIRDYASVLVGSKALEVFTGLCNEAWG